MEAESKAPETEQYLRLRDASDRVIFSLKLLEDEKKKHRFTEKEPLCRIEKPLREAEALLESELKRFGRPIRCPQCGGSTLVEGLNRYDCPVCNWEHQY